MPAVPPNLFFHSQYVNTCRCKVAAAQPGTTCPTPLCQEAWRGDFVLPTGRRAEGRVVPLGHSVWQVTSSPHSLPPASSRKQMVTGPTAERAPPRGDTPVTTRGEGGCIRALHLSHYPLSSVYSHPSADLPSRIPHSTLSSGFPTFLEEFSISN